MAVGGWRLTGEVSKRSSNLDMILLTERNPNFSKIRGFNKSVKQNRRSPIVGDIATKFSSRIIHGQQRQHRVDHHNRRLKLPIRRRHQHVHRRNFRYSVIKKKIPNQQKKKREINEMDWINGEEEEKGFCKTHCLKC